jgi:hypothetical protein
MSGSTMPVLLLGSLLGKAIDPITWLVIAVSLGLAFTHRNWVWVLPTAAAGAAIVVFVVSARISQAGIEQRPMQEWLTQWVLLAVWGLCAYGLMRVFDRRAT